MSMTGTLATRIRQLIALRHSGNISSAARRVGVPVRTLSALQAGRIKNPGAEVVAHIASAFDVSTDWLLNGTGRGPDTAHPAGQWDLLVISLGLSAKANSAMLELPESTAAAALHFRLYAREGNDVKVAPGVQEACMSEYAAWHTWLSAWIEFAGAGHVRERLNADVQMIRERFTGVKRQSWPPP